MGICLGGKLLNPVKFKEKLHKIRLKWCKSASRLRIIRPFVFLLFTSEIQPVETGVFVCVIERFGAINRGIKR